MNEYIILVSKINQLLPLATSAEKTAIYYDLAESLNEDTINAMLKNHQVED